MEDRPYILVGALILILIVGSALAWFVGNNSPAGQASNIETKTFRAKPGTQRESAKALVNTKRRHKSARPGTSTESVEVWGRFEGDGGEGGAAAPEDDARRLVDEVLADLPVEEGIAVLEAELVTAEMPAHIYSALISLYAVEDPADMERVDGAFSLAMANAQRPDERNAALYHYLKVVANRSDWARVLEISTRHARAHGEMSRLRAQIAILEAEALRQTERMEEAVESLETILDAEKLTRLLADPEFRPVYRQAALKLSRIYRELGEPDLAEKVARESNAQLRR